MVDERVDFITSPRRNSTVQTKRAGPCACCFSCCRRGKAKAKVAPTAEGINTLVECLLIIIHGGDTVERNAILCTVVNAAKMEVHYVYSVT